jgi:hypothetical protein
MPAGAGAASGAGFESPPTAGAGGFCGSGFESQPAANDPRSATNEAAHRAFTAVLVMRGASEACQ